MLSLKFARKGKKKYPVYSLIVLEKSKDPWGDYTEKLGTYNPHDKSVNFNAERINYWISKGAQPTETVHNLLVTQGIIKADKVVAGKTKPGKRKVAEAANAKKAEADAKAKAEAEAKAKEEAEAKLAEETANAPVVEEAPVVEAPIEAPTETVVEEVTTEVVPEVVVEDPKEETKTE